MTAGGHNKLFTDAQLRACIDLGMYAAQAARVLGVSTCAVHQRLQHLGWVMYKNGTQRQGLSEQMCRRMHHRRKFTDSELLAAASEDPSLQKVSRKLNCTPQIVSHHARRLGLALTRTHSGAARVFTPEEDLLIIACHEGRFGMTKLARDINSSVDTLRKRALALGKPLPAKVPGGYKRVLVPQVVDKPPAAPIDIRLPVPGDPCADHVDGRLRITNDKLLARLREVHGSPRDEVYPGSVRRDVAARSPGNVRLSAQG